MPNALSCFLSFLPYAAPQSELQDARARREEDQATGRVMSEQLDTLIERMTRHIARKSGKPLSEVRRRVCQLVAARRPTPTRHLLLRAPLVLMGV